jgi:hypothetical protein
MGGAVTFSTDHPNFGRISGTGLFEGGSRPDYAMIRVKNHATLEDGVYEVAAGDMEAVKAIIPDNAPGLIEAQKLDAADGVSANPLAPVTLESLPEATPSNPGQNAYYVEFEGTELSTDEAKRGVHMYVGQGYKLINKILRDNPEGSVEEFIATSNSESYLAEATGVGFDGEFAATAGSKIADLDYAISTTNLKNDTTLYRGMTAKPDRYEELLNMEPGDEFQDFGFVSTSTLEKSAMSFTSTSVQGKEQGRKPILFRIEAGAGSNAMRTFTGINNESEVVLPRGTKVEIVSKSQRDGVLIIDAKVVSTKPAPAVPEAIEAPIAEAPKKELTDQEREALLWFTDDGYSVAADKLRKNKDISDTDQERVDTILALIDSSETTEDRIVYRGKASRSSGRAAQINNLQIGDVMLDPGVGSASPEERVGKKFAEFFQDIPDIKVRYVLAINVPKGSRAYDIPENAHSYGRSEKEILLPPNSAVSVTGIEDRDGVRYITADLVDSAQYLETPSAVAEESGAKDLTGFTQIETQKGSNPGGLYQDPATGEKFYVKFEDAIRVDNEVLASRLYEKTGINAIKVEKGSMDGKTISYSKWEDGTTADLLAKLENDPDMTQKLKEGFAVDAWLANWDVVGLVYDNLIFDAEGNDLRVDPGGALLYRAQGARKGDAFGDVVGELETFQEGGKTTSRIYGNMTQLDRVMSARKLLDISEADIDEMVDAAISDAADNELLKTRLKNRRSYILTMYGLDGKTPAKPSEEIVSGWTETSPGVQGLGESSVFDQTLNEESLLLNFRLDSIPEADPAVFSADQVTAIRGYAGPEYYYMNTLLRTGKVEDKFKDHIEVQISNLDSAMDELGVLEKPARVFRGLTGWKPGSKFNLGVDWAQEMENLKVGDIFTDEGYVSTSEFDWLAYSFFGPGQEEKSLNGQDPQFRWSNSSIKEANASVFFSIDLPAGSKALRIPTSILYGPAPNEGEVLLPRGTKLKVKAIRRVRQDRDDIEAYNYFVDAEAIPQDEVGVIDVVSETAEDRGAVDPWEIIDEANGISGRGYTTTFGSNVLEDNIFDVKALRGDRQYPEDIEMFSDENKRAIKSYTSSTAFKVYNGALRDNDSEKLGKYKESIDQLDAAIAEHGEVFGSDVKVYRGFQIKKNAFEDNAANWIDIIENLDVGDILTDDGYVSTSNSPEVAYGDFGGGTGQFPDLANGELFKSNRGNTESSVFWSIELPEGSTAMAIPKELGYNGNDYEDEVLLPRGAQMEIIAVRKVQKINAFGDVMPGLYNYFLDTRYVGSKPIEIEALKPGEEPTRVEG